MIGVAATEAFNARRWRGRGLVALFIATLALAGGAHALAPAPAAAFQESEEGGCTEVWGMCVAPPQGGSGGAGDNGGAASSGSDDGGAWDGGDDGAGQATNGDDAGGGQDSDADSPFLLASDPSSGSEQPLEPISLDQVDKEKWEREFMSLLQRQAQGYLDALDPFGRLTQQCEDRNYPLRCGVFWLFVAQEEKCERLYDSQVPGYVQGTPEQVDQCEGRADQLRYLFDSLEHLARKGQLKHVHRRHGKA